MLKALPAGLQQLEIRARQVVVLLNQFDLYPAGIGKREAHARWWRTLSPVAITLRHHLTAHEEWDDAQGVCPVVERLIQVAHYEPNLPNRSK